MNKFGIKVYPHGVYNIDYLYFNVNSIKHHNYYFNKSIIKIRNIKYNKFGIKLHIIDNI